ARGLTVMIYDYDMLSQQVHQVSMDAGERWMLNNVVGKPVRAWDSRAYTFRTLYDPLQRPTHLFVQQGSNTELVVERMVYGEVHPDSALNAPRQRNLRGKVFQLYDGAGVVTSEQYDFKGNLLASSRCLAQEYHQTVDWQPLANLTDVQ